MMVERGKEKDWVIYSYTAEEAVRDGVLIEVDPTVRQEAGYRWPVRLSQNVATFVTPRDEDLNDRQSLAGRLWDLMGAARIAISNADPEEYLVPFDVTLGSKAKRLWACLDTTSGPAIHIITPEEY